MSYDEALFARDSLLIQALSQAGDSIELLDVELRLVWVNAAFERLHGRNQRGVIGRTPAELSLGAARFREIHQRAEASARMGQPFTGEVVAVWPDGSEVPIELTVSALRDDDGELRGFFAVKRDRTAAVQARAMKERRERELETLLDRIPLGIVMHQDGVIRYVNDTTRSLVGGRAPLVGSSVFDWIASEDRSMMEERRRLTMAGEAVAPVEMRLLRGEGESVHVRLHPIGYLDYRGEQCFCAVLQDLTAERESREATVTADRLQTIGQIAAGVAHEVNNPLTWIIGGLEEVRGQLADSNAPEATRARVAEALEGARRIQHIVRELALFTRAGDEHAACELGEVATAAAHLARRSIEAFGALSVEGATHPVWVRGSAPKLGQVMLNLLVNAAAAIGAEQPTALSEQATSSSAPPASSRSRRVHVRWGLEDDEAFVEVSDDGVGMPPEVHRRAFDPFFTTRAGRGGTGLGLAISRNIIHALGGRIELTTAPGAGTRALVVIPQVEDPVEPPSEEVTLGSLRVLVIDDERLVAKSLCRRVRQMGHACEAVTSAFEALQLLRTEEPDAILCDLMMPDMDGRELYARLLEELPELASRTIFMTGGAFTEDAQSFLAGLERPWLIKPFDEEDLTRALRKHLYPDSEPPDDEA